MQTYFGYFGHAWLHSPKMIVFNVYVHTKNKFQNLLLSYNITILILQFDWLAALCQICWWNINNNISFHYRLFPRKTNITKFFKKFKKPYFGGKKGSVSFSILELSTIVPKIRKTNDPFLGKLLDGHIKFISLIYLWDTANFRVLQLIEKSCNLIGQEHFGPYFKNQNFPKYEVQAYSNYSNINFHYRTS